MFHISVSAESDSFRRELYDLLQDVVLTIIEDMKKEDDLPYMLSKAQLAKHIFNVSPQTLDTHIINKPDFPKFKAGERILFPRDMVLKWIRKNIDEITEIKEWC